jgi:hypothetical protein
VTKLLLHPPETTGSFTLNLGCGKPHGYDGVHGIDCDPCVQHVATLSPDERVAMHLRGPVPAQGATPEEREVHARAYLAAREKASWRLLPADEATAPAGPSDDDQDAQAARIAELEARIAELEGAGAKTTTGRKTTAKA